MRRVAQRRHPIQQAAGGCRVGDRPEADPGHCPVAGECGLDPDPLETVDAAIAASDLVGLAEGADLDELRRRPGRRRPAAGPAAGSDRSRRRSRAPRRPGLAAAARGSDRRRQDDSAMALAEPVSRQPATVGAGRRAAGVGQAEKLDPHLRQAPALVAQPPRRRLRQVDQPVADEWPAIVDANLDAAAVVEVGHARPCSAAAGWDAPR